MQSLQHLALAMPEDGIAPLAALAALTYLRLKWRKPAAEGAWNVSGVAFAAAASTNVLAVYFFAARADAQQGRGGTVASAPRASLASAAAATATALAVAAAPCLLAAAVRRSMDARSRALAAAAAPPLAALAALTRLEWLELKGSTAVPSGAWRAALAPLVRLRRLDVRGTTFADGGALRSKPRLRVLLATPSRRVSEASLRRQGELAGDVRVRLQ